MSDQIRTIYSEDPSGIRECLTLNAGDKTPVLERIRFVNLPSSELAAMLAEGQRIQRTVDEMDAAK